MNRRLIRGIIVFLALGSISILLIALIPGRTVQSSSSVGGPKPTDHITQPHAKVLDYAAQLREQLIDGRKAPAWVDRSEWSNQCDVGLMNFDCQPASNKLLSEGQHFLDSLTIPPQIGGEPSFFPPAGNHKKQVVPAVLQSIYYNRSSADTIKQNDLANGRAIKNRFNALDKNRVALSDMNIPDFNPDAMIVKTIWETVVPPTKLDPSWVQTNGYYTGIHLYSNQVKCKDDAACELQPIQLWDLKDQVYVDITKDNSCEFTRDHGHRVYTLGCFYHREVTAEDFKQLSGHPHSDFPDLINQNCMSKKCEMVMVGFHVITRETPNWIWATFWWQDMISQKANASLDPWNFFQSNASVNSQDRIANPYLEGPTQAGMHSNCLDCHRFAMFSPKLAPPLDKITAHPTPASRDLQSPNSCFVTSIQTHFLWTIALHAYGNSVPKKSCLDR